MKDKEEILKEKLLEEKIELVKEREDIVTKLLNDKVIWRICNNLLTHNNQLSQDLQSEVVYKLLTDKGLGKFFKEYREDGNWYNYLYVTIKNECCSPGRLFYRELRRDSIKLIDYNDYKNEELNNEEDNQGDQ